MGSNAALILAVFAIALLAAFYIYAGITEKPAPSPTPTLTPNPRPSYAQPSPPSSPASSPPGSPTPFSSPPPSPIPSPSVPQNFIAAWNMTSLQFHEDMPASSFPAPPDRLKRANGSFITLEGKPAILLFTTPFCAHCAWERRAFFEATARFGTWENAQTHTVFYNLTNGSTGNTTYTDLASARFSSPHISVRAMEADSAPYQYQPLFIEYSPMSEVPLILFAGAYYRLGSGETGTLPDARLADEADRLTSAICSLLLPPRPPACPPAPWRG